MLTVKAWILVLFTVENIRNLDIVSFKMDSSLCLKLLRDVLSDFIKCIGLIGNGS